MSVPECLEQVLDSQARPSLPQHRLCWGRAYVSGQDQSSYLADSHQPGPLCVGPLHTSQQAHTERASARERMRNEQAASYPVIGFIQYSISFNNSIYYHEQLPFLLHKLGCSPSVSETRPSQPVLSHWLNEQALFHPADNVRIRISCLDLGQYHPFG